MLKYSPEAAQLKPKFYNHYNTMEIYVEDEGDENFYENLLLKLLDPSIKVQRVFGLGGKPKLLKKLNTHLTKPKNKKVFFIADGDFDRLLNHKLPKTEVFYLLKEYCIENYLLEERAIYEVMQEEDSKKSIKQIKKIFPANIWLKDCVDKLTPLFACYIIIQKHNLGIKNVQLGIGRFLSAGIPKLDTVKIDAFITSLKANNPLLGGHNFDEELSLIQGKMGNAWKWEKRYICGKNYLLPLLRYEVKRHTKRDLDEQSFRFRMMKKCRFHSLRHLKQRIEKVAAM